MTSLIVWCMMTVSLNGEMVETAVKGKVLETSKDQYNDKVYTIDFSEYMKKQGYSYNSSYSRWVIPEYLCTEEK